MTKRALSMLLTLCMVFSLFSGMAFSASADDDTATPDAETVVQETEDTSEECAVKSVFNSDLYVKANEEAGLGGNVLVDFDLIGCTGTLYLPGSADTSMLFFCWDDASIEVSCGDVIYESGTAPVAAVNESVTYKVTKDLAVNYVTVKTLKGSEGVEGMFLNIDESMGTIDAMNSDSDHETSCYGSMDFDGNNYYMSMKGRGNSTWIFEKKPYNITIYKGDDYDKKQNAKLIDGVKSKKWSILANYFDSSLLRNKIAMDLANTLGIGLETRFVDVWMNGEYLGNYLLTPKKDYNTPDEGYILDNDHIEDTESGVQFDFPNIAEMPGKHNVINVEDIGDDAVEAGVTVESIEEWFTEAWNTVLDYDSEEYQNYFDIDSWAKMYLMYEVSKTYDCYSGNILMHRDGLTSDDKLIAGPAWDYDISFGRTLHKFLVGVTEPMQMNAEGWYNDSVGLVLSSEPYSILQGLGMHESFLKRVTEIYNDYKWAFEALPSNVDEQAAFISDSAAMNNDLWGVNHLGADYMIDANTMSNIGSGEYKLNYEVTLTWQNYVNNLKEYCTKRVMWLSDHMYAEYPQGTISQALDENGDVVLRADLTAGKQSNTYQWQQSSNGKKWTDIEGADGASVNVGSYTTCDGKYYRCVVCNEGVEIYTTHGGYTNASAKTVLDAVKVNVTMEQKTVALGEGSLNLMLNGKDMGEYTFAVCGSGWSICNENGKYVAIANKKLVLSDNPFEWSYADGVFSATVRTSYTFFGRWFGITHAQTMYLTQSGNDLSVSANAGATAAFTVRYPVVN